MRCKCNKEHNTFYWQPIYEAIQRIDSFKDFKFSKLYNYPRCSQFEKLLDTLILYKSTASLHDGS